MQSKKLDTNGLQIAYNITNPDKELTIFFIHSNSSSSNTWCKQVGSLQFLNYRLVTIDLPNHGNSDALAVNGDFSLPNLAKIMSAAIIQLSNNQPYLICSISLGTNIVAEMLSHKIEPRGLLLCSPSIVGKGFEMDKMILPGANVTAVFADGVAHEKQQFHFVLFLAKKKK